MSEIKTAGGQIERGPAMQRHLVRQIEQIDGVMIVCPHTSDHVSISVDSEADLPDLIEVIEEYGGDPNLDEVGDSHIYHDGSVSLDVAFR